MIRDVAVEVEEVVGWVLHLLPQSYHQTQMSICTASPSVEADHLVEEVDHLVGEEGHSSDVEDHSAEEEGRSGILTAHQE